MTLACCNAKSSSGRLTILFARMEVKTHEVSFRNSARNHVSSVGTLDVRAGHSHGLEHQRREASGARLWASAKPENQRLQLSPGLRLARPRRQHARHVTVDAHSNALEGSDCRLSAGSADA